MNDLSKELIFAVDKYKDGSYSEKEFHATVESLMNTSNDSQYADFHTFLVNIEANLEEIDFLINKELWKEKYLMEIEKIESFVKLRNR
jgi:hypothetical protein